MSEDRVTVCSMNCLVARCRSCKRAVWTTVVFALVAYGLIQGMEIGTDFVTVLRTPIAYMTRSFREANFTHGTLKDPQDILHRLGSNVSAPVSVPSSHASSTGPLTTLSRHDEEEGVAGGAEGAEGVGGTGGERERGTGGEGGKGGSEAVGGKGGSGGKGGVGGVEGEGREGVAGEASGTAVKIILYTYMRSGSSFTGELFSADKDTFYLFEPVDGMYAEMYGMSFGVFPLDLFYFADGSKRILPDYEIEFVSSATQHILNCDFDRLPVSVVLQKFMDLRTYPGTKPFKQCLNGKTKVPGQNRTHKANRAWGCKHHIAKSCPKHFGKSLNTSQTLKCYPKLHGSPSKDAAELGFQKHDECLRQAEKDVKPCLDLLINSCKKQPVRSFKTIRMTMEVAEPIIKQDPAVKIVYLVRDPRGIVSSRFATNQVSFMSGHNVEKDARALCHRMLFDTEEYERLQERFPRNIVRVRYEDIARAPFEKARDLYEFTRGIPLPENVVSYIKRSTNASRDNGSYGTARANPQTIVNKWRKQLSDKHIRSVTDVCKTVIEKLGYEL